MNENEPVVLFVDEDNVTLHFHEKPTEETRRLLKEFGFRLKRHSASWEWHQRATTRSRLRGMAVLKSLGIRPNSRTVAGKKGRLIRQKTTYT